LRRFGFAGSSTPSGRTGKPSRADTATRMAMDADFPINRRRRLESRRPTGIAEQTTLARRAIRAVRRNKAPGRANASAFDNPARSWLLCGFEPR
jgi:hypothetical protein